MRFHGHKRYDAFLSYNSQDGLAVEELAGRLKAQGLDLYLEVWESLPGREFQPALAEGLRNSKTCVVFLGPNGLGPWQKQEIQVALDKRARDEAFHVIPVLLPGTERPRRGDVALLEFLINASWVEFLRSLDEGRAFRSLISGITGERYAPLDQTRYEGVCPYRGLEAFRHDDQKFFFGREALAGWLVSSLRREVRAAQGVRFLGVLGPSGSGKSSVVLAGLIPKLKDGGIEGSEQWTIAITRPGDDPLVALTEQVVPRARALRSDPGLSELDEQENLLKHLRSDGDDASGTLGRYVGMKLAERPPETRFVIVVDQFEEVFTYRPQDDQARTRFERSRAAFFANLLNAATAPGGRVVVVLTMRSDFLGSCAPFEQLSAVLSAHQEQVGPMTESELREAIECPAVLVGCEVEPALTERLLADVKGRPGGLPLMQFALGEVWKKRDVRRLTLRAYEGLGGAAGALEHRADEIYGHLSPEDQRLCQQLFLRLVQPGEGTEDTKRRVSYGELLLADPARAAAVKKLVQTLAHRDARLITTGGSVATEGAVEVAHEALIRGWTRLRDWVDKDREGLGTHRRLTEAAREWASARPEDKGDYLYSGARLAVCREWATTHREDLSKDETDFLEASQQAERQQAEKQQKLVRRLWIALAGAAVLAAAATGASMVAARAQRAAETAAREARIATIRRMVSQAKSEFEHHPPRGLLLAVEALNSSRRDQVALVPFVTEALVQMLATCGGTPLIGTPGETPGWQGIGLAFGADGILAIAWERTVHLWRLDQLEAPFAVLNNPTQITAVSFNPDGNLLAVSGFGAVNLWRIDKPQSTPHASLQMGGNMGPTSASFSPDGRLALTCDGMGDTFLWRLDQPNTPVVDLSTELERPNFASFRSDGKSILTADISGRVKRWRIDQLDGQHKAVFQGAMNQWTRMAFFSPDGNYLAIPRQVDREALQNTALLFKLEESAIQEVPPHADGQIERRGVAFSSDGKLVVTAGDDFTMRVWKVDKPESPLAVLRGHEGTARAAAFSKDGRFIATAGIDRVRIWRVDQPMAIASHDRTSRNWIARLDELIQLAGKTAGRNLSRAEWQEYFPESPNRKTFVWLSEAPESEPAIQVESPIVPAPP